MGTQIPIKLPLHPCQPFGSGLGLLYGWIASHRGDNTSRSTSRRHRPENMTDGYQKNRLGPPGVDSRRSTALLAVREEEQGFSQLYFA